MAQGPEIAIGGDTGTLLLQLVRAARAPRVCPGTEGFLHLQGAKGRGGGDRQGWVTVRVTTQVTGCGRGSR